MDPPVRGQHVGQPRAEVHRAAVEILDPAPRLGDHERAGADVPGIRGVALQEGVDAAGGDIGQAQRGRADAAHAAAVGEELHHPAAEAVDRGRLLGLDAGAHQALAQHVGGGDVEPLVAQPGPTAPHGREQLAAEGLEDGASGQPVGVPNRDRRARERDAVGVVGGAVERIDQPREGPVGHVAPALLGEDGVVRVVLADHADHLGLGRQVDPRDDRHPLALHLHLLGVVQPLDQDRAGGAHRA